MNDVIDQLWTQILILKTGRSEICSLLTNRKVNIGSWTSSHLRKYLSGIEQRFARSFSLDWGAIAAYSSSSNWIWAASSWINLALQCLTKLLRSLLQIFTYKTYLDSFLLPLFIFLLKFFSLKIVGGDLNFNLIRLGLILPLLH